QSFSIAPGEEQVVTITGLQRGTGSYKGASILSGVGVPSGTEVTIKLLAVPTPDGPTAADPETPRIDVSAPQGSNPSGTAVFRNTGEATIEGTVESSVPWLIPEEGLIVIPPGETATVSFTIDRSQRPADGSLGSREGFLRLVFRTGPGSGKGVAPANGAASQTATTTIVDTATPPVAPGQIPPLQPGNVALFVPGAGHVQGGAGLFFSDINLVNLSSFQTLNDVQMWYTPLNSDQSVTTSFGGIAATTPLAMADVVKTVFESESTLGSLQIRSPNIESLSVSANIFLQTKGENPQFYGNTIPVIRSDRSLGPNQSFYVTGLTQTSQSHTNLFIQETAGGTVVADIEFLDESGQTLGELNGVQVGPFRLHGLFHSQNNPFMPNGSVTAVITSRNESTGRFSAYATPVDRLSGDSWSLVDWNAQESFAGTEEMVIPVAGALQGANNLYFRTDLAAVNRSDETASGILTYITRPGEGRAPIHQSITLGPDQSVVFEDVTTNLFGVDPSQFTLGYMKFLPQSGSLSVTSRNFATVGNDPGTFGTGVATVPATAALQLGDVRRIGGVRDASLETVQKGVPGTFRSNVGLMEVSGQAPVTVRVTVYYSFDTILAAARGSASKQYTLQPNEYLQLNRISREILGESRDDYGNFENLQVDFAIVGGDGAAVAYVSSVENDTGDSILRVD
ncbi:MAG: hypothetical protein KY432_08625, partial [Acidobacteria bacterium]|nr:hypothetical protein [Acidobacteriota bacterium]